MLEAPRPAAIFRLEGGLAPLGTVPAPAYFGLQQGDAGARMWRLGSVLAGLGARVASPLGSGDAAERLAWSALRGLSEDRIAVLGEEYARAEVLPRVRAAGLELALAARRAGFRIVLWSDWIHAIVDPVAAHLGADTVVANTPLFADGRATGRIGEPVVAATSARWLQAGAKGESLVLGASRAYGALGSDAFLMQTIATLGGEVCALHPDWRLRRLAGDQGWPIVDAR